jgi:hypothetical protein
MAAAFLEQYLLWQGQADAAIAKAAELGGAEQGELAGLLQDVIDAAGPGATDDTLLFFLHRIFRHLFEVALAPAPLAAALGARFYATCLQHLCAALATRGPPVSLAAAWGALEDERKWAPLAVEGLVRAALVSPGELDAGLAKGVVLARSPAATDLVLHLAKGLIIRDHVLTYQVCGRYRGWGVGVRVGV